MKRISKEISVTITVYGNGTAFFDYLDPESGDFISRKTDTESMWETEKESVGSELLSWASLMEDELNDCEEESEKQKTTVK